MKQEYIDIPCGSPGAIPYKWESTPGRPIVEVVPVAIEPWKSPLRPPPGANVRKPTKPSESAVDGSKPELPPVLVEEQLAGRILKKLNKLRKKSMVAAACFTSEASRVIEHSGQLFAVEDLDRFSDSDAMSRCSGSTFDQPGTPRSSISFESSFSEPCSSTRNTDATTPSSPYTASVRPSLYHFEDVGELRHFDNDNDIGCDEETLPGPRESAWHQFSGELELGARVPQNFPIRRSHSTLVPALLRYSSSRRLSLGRTFRRSKATKRLDIETM